VALRLREGVEKTRGERRDGYRKMREVRGRGERSGGEGRGRFPSLALGGWTPMGEKPTGQRPTGRENIGRLKGDKIFRVMGYG